VITVTLITAKRAKLILDVRGMRFDDYYLAAENERYNMQTTIDLQLTTTGSYQWVVSYGSSIYL
jgi:hypothetical protein